MDFLSLLPSLCALIVYSNTFKAGFVYDDSRAIEKNNDVLLKTPLTALFFNDFWGTKLTDPGSHGSYRPLCILTFRLQVYLHGLNASFFHIANVCLHGIVCYLLTILVQSLSRRKWQGILCGLLFSVHPIHSEAVAGIVGRADVLAAIFFLLTIINYIKYLKVREHENGFKHLFLVLLFTICSLLSKENGISALGVCLIFDVLSWQGIDLQTIMSREHKKKQKRVHYKGSLFLIFSALTLILFRMSIMTKTPDFSPADNPASHEKFLTRSLTFTFLPTLNFWLLLFPSKLSFDWSMNAVPLVESFSDYRNLFSLFFYSILTYSAVGFLSGKFSGKDCKLVVLSTSILVLSFFPAANLFFYVGFVIAERILYIPSIGYCILVCWGLERRRIGLAAFFLLILILSAKTVIRNCDWNDEESLYKSGIDVNPAKAWGNLANVLNAKGQTELAEYAYRKALSYRSNMADTHYNLGILLQNQGRYTEALTSYENAIIFRPKLSLAYLNIGIVLSKQGKNDDALKFYRRCADLDTSGSKDPKLHLSTKISALFNMGRLLTEQNRLKEALDVYSEALKRRPDDYAPQSIYNMIGEVYSKLGNMLEAEKWYRKSLQAKADHIPAFLTLARLYQHQKNFEKAENLYRTALTIAPDDYSVYEHYGQFLGDMNRYAESAKILERAIGLGNNDFQLVFNAANTLRQANDNEKAEEYYIKATKISPKEAAAHMNLGAIYHLNGKLLKAEESYLEALRLKPNDSVTLSNLKKLRNLIAAKNFK